MIISHNDITLIRNYKDSHMQKYNLKNHRFTFVEWVLNEVNGIYIDSGNKNTAISDQMQDIVKNITNIPHTHTKEGEMVYDLRTRKNVKIEKLYDDYDELEIKRQEIYPDSCKKAIALYVAADEKLKSRSRLSKFFHPFRTKKEKTLLSRLKECIFDRFRIDNKLFSNTVKAINGVPQYANADYLDNNGKPVMTKQNFIDDKERSTIDKGYDLEDVAVDIILKNDQPDDDISKEELSTSLLNGEIPTKDDFLAGINDGQNPAFLAEIKADTKFNLGDSEEKTPAVKLNNPNIGMIKDQIKIDD